MPSKFNLSQLWGETLIGFGNKSAMFYLLKILVCMLFMQRSKARQLMVLWCLFCFLEIFDTCLLFLPNYATTLFRTYVPVSHVCPLDPWIKVSVKLMFFFFFSLFPFFAFFFFFWERILLRIPQISVVSLGRDPNKTSVNLMMVSLFLF